MKYFGDFMAGNLLAHAVTPVDFMAGDFMAGVGGKQTSAGKQLCTIVSPHRGREIIVPGKQL